MSERQVVLDTETTGLELAQGHRVIEIGCVEIASRRVSASEFHHYLNPEREIDAGALAVHGITREFLLEKPRFADVAGSLLDYVRGAELIIHNAPFDVSFLDAELAMLGREGIRIEHLCRVTDSLALARHRHPGQKNSLDALCRRYQVDNSARELHGALLDAEILADVYLAMTGGQTLLFGSGNDAGMDEVPGAGTQVVARLSAASTAEAGAEAELLLDTSQIKLFDRESGRNLVEAG